MPTPAPTLTLDDDHRYWLDTVRIRGVTEILNGCGLIPEFSKDTEAALRGHFVHKACALLVRGELDWASVDMRLIGYVLSYQSFLDQTNFAARAVEVMEYHRDYLYAGTFDVASDDLLLDLKTGSAARWHCLQTAAYQQLIKPVPKKRGALYLQNDGSIAKLVPHTSRADWPNFLSCLNVYRLREEMNGNRNG